MCSTPWSFSALITISAPVILTVGLLLLAWLLVYALVFIPRGMVG
jgi:hypothetical protein